MLKLKNLSYLSLVAFIVLMAAASPIRLLAEDDGPNDEETFTPPVNNSSVPPLNIDESDSGSVSDTEEYDG